MGIAALSRIKCMRLLAIISSTWYDLQFTFGEAERNTDQYDSSSSSWALSAMCRMAESPTSVRERDEQGHLIDPYEQDTDVSCPQVL